MFLRSHHSLAAAMLCALCVACGGGGADNNTAAGSPVSAGADVRPTSSTGQPAQRNVPDTTQQNASVTAVSTSANSSPQVPAADSPFGQDPARYVLTFADNFDGELNRAVWNTGRHDTPDSVQNFATKNGVLKIWPERGKNGKFFYRTLDTEGRFAQRYGFFEIEAKLPKGQGVWPAFWLNYVGEGVYRELDIMEAYASGAPPWSEIGPDGLPTAVMYAPVVWTRREEAAGFAKVPTPDLAAASHRYGVKWEPERITFYFDGKEVLVTNAAIPEPMFMLLDVYFGDASDSGSGPADERTPVGESNSLEINYVKVWQFK